MLAFCLFAENQEYTYFILCQECGYIKIGKTTNIEKRLDALQTGNPFKLKIVLIIKGDKEKELHKLFNQYRVDGGEWFLFCQVIKDFITKQALCQ
jgi:hypothetical protein